jgi:hypothetical protein
VYLTSFIDPRFGEQEEILEQNKQVVAMLEELNRYDFLTVFRYFSVIYVRFRYTVTRVGDHSL